MITSLPQEIQQFIFSYLNEKDLCKISSTWKIFRNMSFIQNINASFFKSRKYVKKGLPLKS